MLQRTRTSGPIQARRNLGDDNMEINTRAQQVTSNVEKVLGEQASRVEAAIGEVGKLQTEGLSHAGAFTQGVLRIVNEQLAFAGHLTGEWRKLVLAATRRAAQV